MSWSIEAAGKASAVKEEFTRKVEQNLTQPYCGESEKCILAAHLAIVVLQCDAAVRTPQTEFTIDEKSVIASSSGHMDSSGNSSSTLTCRTLY